MSETRLPLHTIRRRMRARPWRYLAVALLAVFAIGCAAIAAAGRADPDLIARAADAVRNVIGPAPVAAVENIFYTGADVYARLRYQIAGQADGWQLAGVTPAPGQILPQVPLPKTPVSHARVALRATPDLAIRFAAPVAPPAADAAATPSCPPGSAGVTAAGLATEPCQASAVPTPLAPAARLTTAAYGPLHAIPPLLAGPPQPGEGVWQPLSLAGPPASGQPLLWQTTYRPDPQRPFARVALVAMDLSRSCLHVVIGTTEPVSGLPAGDLRPGTIPAGVLASGRLLAAWNGGFRAVHGHFGMMTDGVTWLPPVDGLATIALSRDGTATLGAWGRGVDRRASWLAWRQNDPPLIESARVNPDVTKYADTARWGASVSGAVYIWRSGLGMTQDRRWLIYAAGNALSSATLTEALRAAGAWDAMQLDVNATWERFVTFSPTPQTVQRNGQILQLPLTAHRLLDQMSGGPTQFILPYDRDFFYLTAN